MPIRYYSWLTFTYILTHIFAANQLVYLPLSLTSLLRTTTFYRNSTESFSFTNLSDSQNPCCFLQQLISSRQASYISYSAEFSTLIGSNSTLTRIEQRPVSIPFAHEGGAYVPETNEVWFTANQLPTQNTNVNRINLATNQVNLLDIQPPIVTPNGVHYYKGSVYVCSQGDKTTPAAIYAVDPVTYASQPVVNSWFGYRLNSPNDVTFSATILNRNLMWFTDPQIAYEQGFSIEPQYRSTVFRFDMLTSELRPVITDLVTPNGIAFNLDETILYVTDTSPSDGIQVVYAYDLSSDGLPINRRVFSVSSFGIPDGIRVDGRNRVWTGEGDGLNVRNSYGTLLGVVVGRDLCASGLISNFGLTGNTVIILAQENLWRLDLAIDVL